MWDPISSLKGSDSGSRFDGYLSLNREIMSDKPSRQMGRLDRTRQGKTKHGMAKQGETRHCMARHGKSRLDKIGNIRKGLGKTRQDVI